MKFGASSWPFQWEPPYEDCIKRVAGCGFKAIELIGWNADFLKDYYTAAKVKELRACLDSEGLEISQFVHSPRELSHPDKAKRQASVDQWKRAVDVGAGLGAKLINMVASHPFAMRDTFEYPRITVKPLVQTYATKDTPVGADWDQNYADYVEALKACTEACAAADTTLTIEPHPGRYLANMDGALRLIDHVNHPNFGINFDPSHTFPCGDFPNITVYRLNRHIKHLHVSDNDGVTNVHWRPGMGKIDWKAMLVALKEVGYDGVISIELEDVPGVSRGPNSNAPGVYRNVTATQEFVDETVLAMKYLKGLCAEVGIKVEE